MGFGTPNGKIGDQSGDSSRGVSSGIGRGPARILVVEDDAAIGSTMVEVLELEGYVVRYAANGAEALELLKSRSFEADLIILDLTMPKMNGYEFRAAQLADSQLADIPAIVLTADRHIESHKTKLDAAVYIQKPVEVDALLEAVRRTSEIALG